MVLQSAETTVSSWCLLGNPSYLSYFYPHFWSLICSSLLHFLLSLPNPFGLRRGKKNKAPFNSLGCPELVWLVINRILLVFVRPQWAKQTLATNHACLQLVITGCMAPSFDDGNELIRSHSYVCMYLNPLSLPHALSKSIESASPLSWSHLPQQDVGSVIRTPYLPWISLLRYSCR